MVKKILFLVIALGVAYFAFQKGVFDDSVDELNEAKNNATQEYEKITADIQEAKDKVDETKEGVESVVESVNEAKDKVEGLANELEE